MRKISAKHLTEVIKREVIAANLQLGDDMIEALRRARNIEESEVGKEILDKLLENAELASANRIPICQDTGLV
ncbi:MAG: fumarate hydratase, partial [Deltaproteobacteria bacterium]